MDKMIIPDSKIDYSKYRKSPDVEGIQQIHRDYGLWICLFGKGNHTHPKPRTTRLRYTFSSFGICHMYAGKGWYKRLDKDFQELKPGHCIISTPGTVCNWGGDDADFFEDYMRFSGVVAEGLFRAGVLRSGVFFLGRERRLLPVIEMASNPSRDSQINANIELQKLLIDIYNRNKSVSPQDSSSSVLEKLLEVLKNSPKSKWWTVNEMAEFCNYSESHFRKIFRDFTGYSPKEYLDKLKIQEAAVMLASSTRPVAEIALLFGYGDPFHFSRRFKEIKGLSPENYRKAI